VLIPKSPRRLALFLKPASGDLLFQPGWVDLGVRHLKHAGHVPRMLFGLTLPVIFELAENNVIDRCNPNDLIFQIKIIGQPGLAIDDAGGSAGNHEGAPSQVEAADKGQKKNQVAACRKAFLTA
jgi:hypothetical protein